MSGESKRLDEQFGWAERTELKNELRSFTRAVEARISSLDTVVATVPEAVALMRSVALNRINEVLDPAYKEITRIIELGFPSVKIEDSGAYGRSVLSSADRAALFQLLAPTVDDITDGGVVGDAVSRANTHSQVVTALALVAADVSGAAPLASPTFTGTPAAPTAAAGTNTTQLATTAFVAALGALKANLASPTFTGTPAAPTAAAGTNTTQIATTAFVAALGALKANLASPTFTGTPSAPTAAAGTNTDQLATTAFVAALGALKANLASPALSGTPTAPTAAAGTNSTQLATTAFVAAAIASLVNTAPAALDTLNELAAALGNDPNFATTISTQIGNKADLASPTFTGTPSAPTPAAGTNTTQIATTAFVVALFGGKADLASPAFTGTPTAPTAAAGTNTTQLATTAFVAALGALKANLASPTFTGTVNMSALQVNNRRVYGSNVYSAGSSDVAIGSNNTVLASFQFVATSVNHYVVGSGAVNANVATDVQWFIYCYNQTDAVAVTSIAGAATTTSGQGYSGRSSVGAVFGLTVGKTYVFQFGANQGGGGTVTSRQARIDGLSF